MTNLPERIAKVLELDGRRIQGKWTQSNGVVATEKEPH